MTGYLDKLKDFYVSALGNEVADVLTKIEEHLADATLKDLSEGFAFTGFDPKQMLAALFRLSKKKGAEVKIYEAVTDVVSGSAGQKIEYKVSGEALKTFSGEGPFMLDMVTLLALFANRGSNWVKAREKMDPQWANVIWSLAVKYNLRQQPTKASKKTALKNTDITLPRIAAIFPGIVAEIFHMGHGKPLYGMNEIGLPTGVSKCWLTPLVASLLPLSWQKKSNVRMLAFLCSVLVDDVINPVDATPLKRILMFFNISLNSAVAKDDLRVAFMDKVGCTLEQIKVAANGAEARIRALRPKDENLDSVISSLRSDPDE
uniref:Putative nucleoprotein n=1 Tax=Hubei bunya-like virus 3 TaxID=1922848 RepID=A0A1L3KPH1_9VIRU|nr:putative nucleoprotein [Hubei bunya-like virus 3]